MIVNICRIGLSILMTIFAIQKDVYCLILCGVYLIVLSLREAG